MTSEYAPGFQARIPVGLLGSTGSVGQRFVQLLHEHPWFELVWLAASDGRAGETYGSQVAWAQSEALPEAMGALTLSKSSEADPATTPLVFSALPASAAGPLETLLSERGIFVVSNARSHRMNADVPLLIPEVNAEHLDHLNGGHLVTGPNCCVAGLMLALAPLHQAVGLKRIFVASMQALSGAGLPGAAGPLSEANVLPHIEGEVEKVETEPFKILSTWQQGQLVAPTFQISALCNRVPVVDGHTMSVSLELEKSATSEDLIQTWNQFKAEPQALALPSAPAHPVQYHPEPTAPTPLEYAPRNAGMTTHIGQLAPCPILGHKFTLSTHNTLRGAAAGNLLIAELLAAKGMLGGSS